MQSHVAPTTSEQTWYGAPYQIDLTPFRERIVTLASESTDKKAGLREVAAVIGISRFTFYRFLKGGSVSINTVRIVCEKMGLDFAQVVIPLRVLSSSTAA